MNTWDVFDQQVKIRGFRIELPEIEAMLVQHPAVRETVVVAHSTQTDDKHLVAYVVLHQQQTANTTELRNYLKDQLPEYMVPSVFVMLESLPLTANGKLDHRALPAPDFTRPELEVAYVMPQTQLERNIATIWQKALNVDKVGIHDNFFELGGHSLLILQVHSELRQIFKRDISMLDLFRYPTIHYLAEYLSQINNKSSSVNETDIVNEKIKDGTSRLNQIFKKMQSNLNS